MPVELSDQGVDMMITNPPDVARVPEEIGNEPPTHHDALALAFAELWRIGQSGDGPGGPAAQGSFASARPEGDPE